MPRARCPRYMDRQPRIVVLLLLHACTYAFQDNRTSGSPVIIQPPYALASGFGSSMAEVAFCLMPAVWGAGSAASVLHVARPLTASFDTRLRYTHRPGVVILRARADACTGSMYAARCTQPGSPELVELQCFVPYCLCRCKRPRWIVAMWCDELRYCDLQLQCHAKYRLRRPCEATAVRGR